MVVPKLMKKSEFAKYIGVSATIVTRLCKKEIKRSLVSGRININSSCVVRYLEKRETRDVKGGRPPNEKPDADLFDTPDEKPKGKPGRPRKASPKIDFLHPDDDLLKEYGNMTLKTILTKYGTLASFADLLKSMKSIEDIIEKRLKNHKLGGELISREYVSMHIFGAVKTITHRLLNDSPKTITARVVSSLKSGSSEEEIEVLVRGLISSQIKTMKQKVTKGLKSA